jgi:hypothetical protein
LPFAPQAERDQTTDDRALSVAFANRRALEVSGEPMRNAK